MEGLAKKNAVDQQAHMQLLIAANKEAQTEQMTLLMADNKKNLVDTFQKLLTSPATQPQGSGNATPHITPDKASLECPSTPPDTRNIRSLPETKRDRFPTVSPERPAPRVRDYSYVDEGMSGWDKDDLDLEETLTQEPIPSTQDPYLKISQQSAPPMLPVDEEKV